MNKSFLSNLFCIWNLNYKIIAVDNIFFLILPHNSRFWFWRVFGLCLRYRIICFWFWWWKQSTQPPTIIFTRTSATVNMAQHFFVSFFIHKSIEQAHIKLFQHKKMKKKIKSINQKYKQIFFFYIFYNYHN